MNEILLNQESLLRLLPFFLVFSVMAVFESYFPRRQLSQSKQQRWQGNLSIVVLNTLLVRLMFVFLGTGTVAFALYVDHHDYGLLQQYDLPLLLVVVLGIICLDLAIYWQHRLFHLVPWLWRLHQVHHADRDLDVSSALRFHPVEIILSLWIKLTLILILGVPPLAVLLFEVLLNGMAMFNHANIRLSLSLDKYLRFLVITPDAHRIHHSILIEETNSNYGFNLSCWDRLFGSYRQQPQHGQLGMTIGLEKYQHASTAKLGWMLRLPIR